MIKDETGNKYGILTVIKLDHVDKKRGAYWLCSCECGCTTVANGNRLRKGRTKSCGCLFRKAQQDFGKSTREITSERMKEFSKTWWTEEHRNQNREKSMKHGGTGTRLYRVWAHMRERCESENGYHARWYHNKGIKVCDEWNDFDKFRSWAFANGYKDPKNDDVFKDYMSIDRIDPTKGYAPENCRWITVSENSKLRNQYYANQR